LLRVDGLRAAAGPHLVHQQFLEIGSFSELRRVPFPAVVLFASWSYLLSGSLPFPV
jgi:hypothetical protein